jgi:uncharacterized membrane-anchored protein YhcB (DUF1043 family)
VDLIKDWWGVIMAALAGLFWLSRLEWRSVQNQADIDRLWKQRKEDLDNAQHSRDETAKMLTEMRSDIKTLLQRSRD